MSDTYLSLFLAQLRTEGFFFLYFFIFIYFFLYFLHSCIILLEYSIHVILGSLPSSEADQLLSLMPYEPSHQTNIASSPLKSNSDDEFETNLAQAIHASLTGSYQIK